MVSTFVGTPYLYFQIFEYLNILIFSAGWVVVCVVDSYSRLMMILEGVEGSLLPWHVIRQSDSHLTMVWKDRVCE